MKYAFLAFNTRNTESKQVRFKFLLVLLRIQKINWTEQLFRRFVFPSLKCIHISNSIILPNTLNKRHQNQRFHTLVRNVQFFHFTIFTRFFPLVSYPVHSTNSYRYSLSVSFVFCFSLSDSRLISRCISGSGCSCRHLETLRAVVKESGEKGREGKEVVSC